MIYLFNVFTHNIHLHTLCDQHTHIIKDWWSHLAKRMR